MASWPPGLPISQSDELIFIFVVPMNKYIHLTRAATFIRITDLLGLNIKVFLLTLSKKPIDDHSREPLW